MGKGIIVAGNLLVDYVKMTDTYPDKGMLCNISDVSQCVGGCASNTLIDLAIIDQDIPLKCIGAVGDDSNGEYLIQMLSKYHIDTQGIKVYKNEVTSFTDVMTVIDTGERTFFHARGANAIFSDKDIDFDYLSADIFHIGYALLLDQFDSYDEEHGTMMAKTLARVQSMGIKTSMDLVSEDSDRFAKVVKPSLKYCNYFISNEIEAGKTVDILPRDHEGRIDVKNIEEICKQILDLGVKDLVVIHAPEGGWAMGKERRFYSMPSLKLPKGYIKGSVGAGDAFCAGMLYALYKNFDIEEGLKIASATAACNLSHSNSISGMRPLKEVMELYNLYHQ